MEQASTHIRLAIEGLLSAYALANMNRANPNTEYRKSALEWFDKIERNIDDAKRNLNEENIND